jgi:hypothetical protein
MKIKTLWSKPVITQLNTTSTQNPSCTGDKLNPNGDDGALDSQCS